MGGERVHRLCLSEAWWIFCNAGNVVRDNTCNACDSMKNTRIVRNVKLGLKDIVLHKGRSLLTSLGVVFGIGSVIAMLAVGEGASEQALEQIRMLGSNNILLTSVQARLVADAFGASTLSVMAEAAGARGDPFGAALMCVIRCCATGLCGLAFLAGQGRMSTDPKRAAGGWSN